MAISGDILVATLGWSRDAVVGAEQPSVTENGAAQTVPNYFQVFELQSHASIKDVRACVSKSALNPFTSLPSQEVYPEIQLILLHPGFLSRTLLFLSPGPAGRLTRG